METKIKSKIMSEAKEKSTQNYIEGNYNCLSRAKRYLGACAEVVHFLRLRILYIMNGKLSGITKKDRNLKNRKIKCISRKKYDEG